MINKYHPDSNKTRKGHLKGQHQGIRSTKQQALNRLVKMEEERVQSKKEPWAQNAGATKLHDIFISIQDLTKSIHTNQTGAFPYTSQQGNRYIIVGIHLDAKNIFLLNL
jgi:hypothetical protein